MYSLLIAIIYLTFIALGLPDALLGSAWPMMVGNLSVPLSYGGIISMIISGGTIVSSLFSDKLTRVLKPGLVTAISILLTAVALFGFSVSNSFWLLCLLAIPYGLGAGAVDAAINNYVALHYSSRHMNWLHCFWGVGATVGPYIMGWAISITQDWRLGYSTVALIQVLLTLILFCSLPMWKGRGSDNKNSEDYESPIGMRQALGLPGVKALLIAFFCYSAFESTAGLWASSYLVNFKGIDVETAATFAALFYLGITGGRFACGLISDRVGDRNMIRLGIGIIVLGILLIVLPLPKTCALAGLVICGVGAAPVYPAIIHATPDNFGKENTHAIVGIQMACAYCGSTFMAPLFGVVAQYVDIRLYPFYLAFFVVLLFLLTERVNRICKK